MLDLILTCLSLTKRKTGTSKVVSFVHVTSEGRKETKIRVSIVKNIRCSMLTIRLA